MGYMLGQGLCAKPDGSGSCCTLPNLPPVGALRRRHATVTDKFYITSHTLTHNSDEAVAMKSMNRVRWMPR